MKTIQAIEKLYRLHKMILAEHTGSSETLSSKLDISRRTVQDYLQYLRGLGAVICYDGSRNTYFYENKFCIEYVFKVTVG
jgi:predicted DNA-binding transcriptional regulator YafY